MRDYLIFGGVDSREFDLYVFQQGEQPVPAQEYERLTIPGRNGQLLMRQKRYPDVEITYTGIAVWNYRDTAKAYLNRLLALNGYQRLEYSGDGETFFKAYIESNVEPEITRNGDTGKFKMTFTRKAERYLYAGERTLQFSESGSINNPTMFDSRPLLRVYGAGDLYIGNDTITITQADQYTDIDCDIMEAYKDSAAYPKNQYVELSGIDYPTLKPGNTNISWGTGITGVDIIPRWWML